MPTERITNVANVVNGKIYVISGGTIGYIAQYLTSNANEVYDPENDSWTQLEPIPTPVYEYASVVLDNKIYIIGGREQGVGPRPSPITLVQIYDPKTNLWTEGTPLKQPVARGAAIATTGLMAPKRIYVIGGDVLLEEWPVSNSDHNQIYDLQTESWDFGAQMPTGRSNLALVNVDDILYALGGINETGAAPVVPWDATEEEKRVAADLESASRVNHANERYTPIGYKTVGYKTVPPLVSLVSPQNQTYNAANVSLAFTVNKPVYWMGYSLDGQDNVTVTGNTTLSALSSGLHNVTVYAKDVFGNTGVSKIIHFSVDVAFPTTIIIASVIAVSFVGVGLLVYFKKRKH
jgi:hypothetical protein